MTTRTLPINHPFWMSRLWIQTIFHHMSTAISDLTLPDSVSQLQMGLQEGKSIYHRNEQLIHQHITNLPPSPYPALSGPCPASITLQSSCLLVFTVWHLARAWSSKAGTTACLFSASSAHRFRSQLYKMHVKTETWSQLRFISLDYREISGQYWKVTWLCWKYPEIHVNSYSILVIVY